MILKPQKLVDIEPYKLEFRKILLDSYFKGWDASYLASEAGKADVENHVCHRMMEVENTVLPWLAEVYDLIGKSVFEIGCGTGSTTIPFALRVDSINSYDVDETSIEVAKHRARLLDIQNTKFELLEPNWAHSEAKLYAFAQEIPKVDVVLMMALLEHMTIEERVNALKFAWQILKPQGIIIIYETPNRISYFDWHSFLLPFFHYLPDRLAFLYSVKTPRSHFSVSSGDDWQEKLYRLGRGVSYHEFELALDFTELAVINDGFSAKLQHRDGLSHPTFDRALFDIFKQSLPDIPLGFAKPSLDLIIQKISTDSGKSPDRAIPSLSSEQIDRQQLTLTESGDREQLTKKITALEDRIVAMESSKFWQLRKQWFQIKRQLGLTQEEP